MSILESLIVSVFCMALVFIVLACLFFAVRILIGALGKIAEKKALASASRLEEAQIVEEDEDKSRSSFSSGTLKLLNVDEKTAAMIMAIVSNESKIPLSELCFKSIKALE